MTRPITQYVRDVLTAIRDIEDFIEGIDQREFKSDKEKQYAVARGLQIIGDGAKKIDERLPDERHTDIPWSDMAKMRDKLVHGYFAVNRDIVWTTIREELPELESDLETLLETLEESSSDRWVLNHPVTRQRLAGPRLVPSTTFEHDPASQSFDEQSSWAVDR
ncbi:MAG: DUF86 domain-containing protein, partial [Bradymonadaceae bacterium]